jgi:hypothetical protein
MGHGLHQVFVKTMASADSVISGWDLGRAFSKVYLQIPTMSSNSALDVYASVDGSSFYQIRKEAVSTSTVQAHSYIVAASAAANGGIVPLPGGFRYYKIQATDSAPTAATTFKIICSDN